MKRVSKNFVIYALPDIISRFLPFFTLPITTAYLSLRDFGNLALFSLCTVPFACLTEYGAGYVIFSSWFKYDKRQRGELLFTLIAISMALHVTAILVIGTFNEQLFTLIAGKDWASIRDLYWWLILMVLSGIPSSLFISWVVIEQKAILSSTVQIIGIVLGTGVMLAVTILTQNYRYIIMGNVIVACIISFIKISVVIPRIHARFKKEYFVLTYKVGSPIFFRSIFNQIKKQIDKFYVASLWGGSQFALYNFSSRFHSLYSMFGSNFDKSYQPDFYQQLAAGKVQLSNLRRILFLWFYSTFLACSLLFVLGKPAINLLTHGVFNDAYPLVLLFSCCIVVTMPFLANGAVIVYHQETKYLLFCTVISSTVALLGCIILVPKHGAVGGIGALWLGTLVNGLLYFRKKRKLLPDSFIEKTVWFYVFAYHVAVIFRVMFEVHVHFSIVGIVFIISTVHGYYRLREYIFFVYDVKIKRKFLKLYVDTVKSSEIS